MRTVGILNDIRDIHTNLAVEEFLLKFNNDDLFMLWQSDPAIVIGKHQNAFAEFNLKYVNEKNIAVARRISGGGTVYHGPGNLNFTFIMNGNSGKLVDFKKFVAPVISYLESLGLKPSLGKGNDILINGLKISGNAEHIHKNRTLHHGTLLFDSDLNTVKESLKVVPGRYQDKAIQSNRAEITNIKYFIQNDIGFNSFSHGLFISLKNYFNADDCRTLTIQELKQIGTLRNEKYSTKEWIYGYSPDFRLSRQIEVQGTWYDFEIAVRKGNISEFRILNSDQKPVFDDFSRKMINVFFATESVRNILSASDAIPESRIDEFVNALFFE